MNWLLIIGLGIPLAVLAVRVVLFISDVLGGIAAIEDAADQRLHDETDWLGVGRTELGARGIHSGEINDAAQ